MSDLIKRTEERIEFSTAINRMSDVAYYNDILDHLKAMPKRVEAETIERCAQLIVNTWEDDAEKVREVGVIPLVRGMPRKYTGDKP